VRNDDLVLFLKLVCGFCEGLLRLQKTRARLAAQTEIPVFGVLLRLRDFVFFGADAELATVDGSGALPEAAVATLAVATLIDLNQSA
jgi:hypothetical protein